MYISLFVAFAVCMCPRSHKHPAARARDPNLALSHVDTYRN